MGKLMLPVALLLVLLGGLFYFQNRTSVDNNMESGDAARNEEVVKVRFGIIGTDAELVSYVIQKEGYDKENNISIEEIKMKPTDAVVALMSDEVDIVPISPILAAKLSAEGKLVKMILPAVKLTVPIYVRESSTIESLDELEGENIGVMPASTGMHQTLKMIYAAQGIDYEEYFNVNVGAADAIVAQLRRGEVEAAIVNGTPIPFSELLLDGELKYVGSEREMLKELYGDEVETLLSGYSIRDSWYQESPEEVKALARAIRQAQEYIFSDPDIYAREDVKELFELTDEQLPLIKEFVMSYQLYDLSDWGSMIDNLNMLSDVATEAGVLETLPDEQVFIDVM